MSDETPTVSEVVALIFKEYKVEPLKFRREPRYIQKENNVSTMTTSIQPMVAEKALKRQKIEVLPQEWLNPGVIRHVADFLDPIELTCWSNTCTATRKACSLACKLDSVFRTFCILKRYADRVHEKRHNWKSVLWVLLEALKELYKVYGPFQVHPLHAAMIGEALMMKMAEMENLPADMSNERDRRSMLSLGGGYVCDTLVCGRVGDSYFDEVTGLPQFLAHVTAHPEIIPPGPGRILAQEGRMPFINIFNLEEEENSFQWGLSFQNYENGNTNTFSYFAMSVQSHTNPFSFFAMSVQSLLEDEAEEDNITSDVCRVWYNGPNSETESYIEEGFAPWPTSGDAPFCGSVEEVFCRYPIDGLYGQRAWDDWTQILRAAWLQAHNIAPFDRRTKQGKESWERVINVMPPPEVQTGND